MTIYHCIGCHYTGTETGWHLGHGVNACPNECVFNDGSKLDDDYISLLEYDPEDDSFPDASEAEHARALAAVHEYQKQQMSPLGKEAFDLGAMMMGAV